MPRSILFGYTVEKEDGKVIVTIEGEMAGEVMTRLSSRRSRSGHGGSTFPFGPLGSPSMSMTSLFSAGANKAEEDEADEGEPNLAEIFGQGFDRTYDEYETKLHAYREILAASAGSLEEASKQEPEPEADVTVPGKARAAAPAKSAT